jgi:hypothetical protein
MTMWPKLGKRFERNMRPKIIIPLSIQFSVRYLVRTGFLDAICQYCEPIILLSFDDGDLEKDLLEREIKYLKLSEIHLSAKHRHIRNKINFWWQKKYLRSSNTIIDDRRNSVLRNKNLVNKVKNSLVHIYYWMRYDYLGGIKKLFREDQRLFQGSPEIAELKNIVQSLKPDAYISIAPFLLSEEMLSRIVAEMEIPSCASILSFDNLLRSNHVPVVFNQYFLWNKDMQAQLLRSVPKAASSRIEIIGAPQFDFYYDESYIWDKETWRRNIGLPEEDRPVILFGAGYYQIVPNEHHWLRQLDDAVESGDIKGNPIILFRIHPLDPLGRWKPILKKAKNIVFDEPWKTPETGKGKANITRKDIEKLVSTLYHSQVHINASSTMTVDGAIFDKPQIGPAYDDQLGKKYDRIAKELYEREHFVSIVKSGGLELAHSRDELISLINYAFEYPGRLSSERKNLVKEICTFYDGKGAERLEKAFNAFLTSNNLK